MRTKLGFLLCVALVLNASAAEDVTQKAIPLANTTAEVTTPQPKINITASAICKKCACNVDYALLDCSRANMSSWFTDDEWKDLTNGDVTFKTLKMEHNNLTAVPVLPVYPFEKLHLAFNQISEIAIGAFHNLNLTVLDLSHNHLTAKAMVPDVFKGTYSPADYEPLKTMRELDLGYNDLHTLDADLFEHLPRLETLILCENTFKIIDLSSETAISGLTYLKSLDMSYMELKDLPDTMLHGPRDLETLILSGNLFTKLPEGLQLATNLQRLVLDENLFTNISDDNIFPPLGNLRELYLSYMPHLEIIGKNAFSNLQNLTMLIASNNPKLSSIDENAFAKEAEIVDYYDYPPLAELHLQNNNLTTIDRRLLRRWDKVKIIDLALNPWACTLTNSWLINVLMVQINSSNPEVTTNLRCAGPPAWKGVLLTDLNLRNAVLVSDENHPERDSLILVGILVGVLIGIPLAIASIVLYRRGCFGLVHRGTGSNAFLYNRANFNEDLHI